MINGEKVLEKKINEMRVMQMKGLLWSSVVGGKVEYVSC